MKKLLVTLLWLLVPALALAQAAPVHGDYNGILGPLHLRLHIVAGSAGELSGTLDSPDQGAAGIPCADFKIEGQNLTFSVPVVNGNWRGSFSQDGATLTGTWNQGTPLALSFTRDNFIPAAKPSPIDGYWLGTFKSATGEAYRLQMTLKSSTTGQEFCSMDSPDQNTFGTPCTVSSSSGRELSFEVPSVRESWKGTLSADGDQLTGTVAGQQAGPLVFARQASLLAPLPPPKRVFDPAMPPVAAADMQTVLAKDLEQALKSGALAPETMAGVSIGVLSHGVSRVFAFGTAKPDSLFEIGSITKTFTGLILAQMIAQQKVHLDDPVRTLLPRDAVPAPAGAEITLLDLVTQHSGLPRMPDNFHPADINNPYADYRAADLYSFLRQHGVQRASEPGYLYSNLGVGLLGQALANRAGTSYADLLSKEVLIPLGMHDTSIKLSPALQARFIQGYSADHKPVHAWDLDALAGAGAIRSDAADMLLYLNANLHPDKLPASATKSAEGRTLPGSIELSHQLRNDAGPATRIAFAWMFIGQSQVFWHNGATGGYSSFAFFNPKDDFAAVVLLNTSPSARSDYADLLGQHISQRFAGVPAISLGTSP